MYTISSIANTSYMLYAATQKVSSSVNANSSSWLTSLSNGSSTNTSGISSLLDSSSSSSSLSLYGSTAKASTYDLISKKIFAQQNDISALEMYSKNQTTFKDDFSHITTSLKGSAKALANTNFDIISDAATSTADKIAAVVKNVKTFAADYNGTVDFLSDNAKLSSAIKGLSISYADTQYNKHAYDSIGISTDTSGRLSVNTDKLSAALTSDSDNVRNLLGAKGLAASTYNKTSAAANADNLYPSVTLSSLSSKYSSTSSMLGMMLDFYL